MPRKQAKGKYKLKTHKATSKRFQVTGTGVLVRTKGG
jgi:large subunit ribosomal protein L35